MEVEAGNENMKFETGPFSYYGVMALNAPTLGESKTSALFSFNELVLSVYYIRFKYLYCHIVGKRSTTDYCALIKVYLV